MLLAWCFCHCECLCGCCLLGGVQKGCVGRRWAEQAAGKGCDQQDSVEGVWVCAARYGATKAAVSTAGEWQQPGEGLQWAVLWEAG